jgi:formylglycine-generating enzyme required for sulfatase activity
MSSFFFGKRKPVSSLLNGLLLALGALCLACSSSSSPQPAATCDTDMTRRQDSNGQQKDSGRAEGEPQDRAEIHQGLMDGTLAADLDGVDCGDLCSAEDAKDGGGLDTETLDCPEACPMGESCYAGQCQCVCGDGLCCGEEEEDGSCLDDCPPPCESSCNPDLEECALSTTGQWVCSARMVAVPAGNFWMGCNNCEGTEANDMICMIREHPYHEVFLDDYWIARTEATVSQYEACVSASVCTTPADSVSSNYGDEGMGNHPVNAVTWYQASTYCAWVGKTLCSEAQWEKAARGGCEKNGGPISCKAQSRLYPWGNTDPSCGLTVMTGCSNGTQPVCSLSPAGDSPYQVCDMAGNLIEWGGDWYLKDYYCGGDVATGNEDCPECGLWPNHPSAWSNPGGPTVGSYRSLRGGCFGDFGLFLRVSSRHHVSPDGFDMGIGFRCCRTP